MSIDQVSNSQTQAINNLNSESVNSKFGCSVQFMYAQLQMELASSNKDKALEKISSIRVDQQTSANYTSTINAMRDLKSYDCEKYGELPTDPKALEQEIANCQAALNDFTSLKNDKAYADAHIGKNSTCWVCEWSTHDYLFDNEYVKDAPGFDTLRCGGRYDRYQVMTEIDAGIEAFSTRLNALQNMQSILNAKTASEPATSIISDCNITLSSNFTNDDLDSWIASLEATQEEIGTDIQQEMVFIQDYMGQYNSYTQGASSAISEANDTLKTVARG